MDVCALERKDIYYYTYMKPYPSRAKVPDAAGGEGLSVERPIEFKPQENATMDSETTSFSFFFKPSCSSWPCLVFAWNGRINIFYFQNGTFKADVSTNEDHFDMKLLQKANEANEAQEDEPDKSDKIGLIGMEPDKSDKIGLIGMELSVIGLSRNKDQSHENQVHLERFFRIGIKYDGTVSPAILTFYVDGIPTSVNDSAISAGLISPGLSANYGAMGFGTLTCFHFSDKVENEEFFETGNLQECSEYLHQ